MEETGHSLKSKISKNEKKHNLEIFTLRLKRNIFHLFFIVTKNHNDTWIKLILFTIIEFIQLIAFPLSSEFSIFWKNSNFMYISSFFNFFQFVNIWKSNYLFYLIAFTITCIYLFSILILFIYLTISLASLQVQSKLLIKIIGVFFSCHQILSLPILKMLISIYNCKKDNNVNIYYNYLRCDSIEYIIMAVIGTLLIIIYIPLSLIITKLFFDYNCFHSKPSGRFSSFSEVLLFVCKCVLIVIYEFTLNNNSTVIIGFMTLIISLVLLVSFYNSLPYYNQKVNSIYSCFYFAFFWSCLSLVIAIILEKSKFTGGLGILFIGFPIVIVGCLSMYWTPNLNLIMVPDNVIRQEYQMLKRIEIFIQIIERCEMDGYRKEQTILLGHLQQNENLSDLSQLTLVQLLQVTYNSFQDKNQNKDILFDECKILFMQYVEFLYKVAIRKFPYYIKLRLSYAMFLFEKLNKKQKGISEIETVKTFKMTLEEEYCIYKCEKILEEDIHGIMNDESVDYISALAYKSYVSIFKSLIIKVSVFYTEFWSLLLIYDENDTETTNFSRMSELGKKIIQTISDINDTFQKIEKIHSNEIEVIKLYGQFLSEIVNDHKKASVFYNKLLEIGDKKEKYDENNLFTLNFKTLSKSEDYQYLIVNAQNDNFGAITNVSLLLCSLLGFTREELIGQNLDIIIPEILHETHNQVLKKHQEKFKKDSLFSIVNHKEGNGPNMHSSLKNICAFAQNKSKYLIRLKFKTGMIVTEDGKNYFIAQLISDNVNWDGIENQVCYVLTNNNLIIQNFSVNAIKLLNLNSSSINNAVDITDFIKEFNEDFLRIALNYEEDISQKKKQIKSYIINKTYRKPSEITWNLNINQNIGCSRLRSFTNHSLKHYLPQNDFITFKKHYVVDFKGKNHFPEHKLTGHFSQLHENNSKSAIHIQGYNKNTSKNNNDNSYNNLGNNINYHKLNKKDSLFYLTISDIVLIKKQVGYIFKFETSKRHFNSKHKNSYIMLSNTKEIHEDSSVSNFSKENAIKEIENHAHSFISPRKNFNPIMSITTGKDFDKTELDFITQDYIPDSIYGKTFSLNIDQMAFNQNNKLTKEELRNELRNIALSKITHNIIKKKKESNCESEDSEEDIENEDSEGDSKNEALSSSGNPQSSSVFTLSNISTKKEKENKTIASPSNKNCLEKMNNKSNSFFQFYRVDLTNIRLFKYNFEIGIVEEIKDQPKLSEVDMKTNNLTEQEINLVKQTIHSDSHEQHDNKGNDDNTKNASSNINNKNSQHNKKNEKIIIINQIEKSLNDRSSQPELIKFFLVSILIFIIFLIMSIISLIIYKQSKSKILTYFNLIVESIDYLQGLMFSVFSIRELTLLNHEGYSNIYEENRNIYINEMLEKATSYFSQSSQILADLTAILNDLPENERTGIQSTEIEIMILTNNTFINTYSLSMENALIENTMALYHVSLLNASDIISLNKDTFYFLKNSLNNIMVAAEQQVEIFFNHFLKQTRDIRKDYIIFIIILVIVYIVTYIGYIFILQGVENLKERYLSIFYEIGKGFIISSLFKCEHLSQKLQIDKNIKANKNESTTFSSSFLSNSFEHEDYDVNKISTNISSSFIKEYSSYLKQDKKKSNYQHNNLNSRLKNIKLVLLFLFVFLFLCIFNCVTYIVALLLSEKYDNFAYFVFYHALYQNKYLFLFISIRELMYDTKRSLKGVDIYESTRKDILSFWTDTQAEKTKMNRYLSQLPEDFKVYYEHIITCNLCEEDKVGIAHNLSKINVNCSEFLYGSLTEGLKCLFSTFIEEVRLAKNYFDRFKSISDREGIVHNYTLLGSDYYQDIIPKDNITKWKIFNETEPMNVYNMTLHKNLIIVNSFIFRNLFSKISDEMNKSINNYIKFNSTVVYILICLFLGIVVLLFFFGIIPFQVGLKETIYKSKKMLSIIPKEVLATLPQVKKMLNIDVLINKKL